MTVEDRRLERAEAAIRQAWPTDSADILTAMWDEDACGALAWRLDQLRRCGGDPVAALREIDEGTLEWAVFDADNVAVFLASRIPTTQGGSDDPGQLAGR